jgi:predicted transcriptional regulator
MKQPTSFRVSEEALRLLRLLAELKGVSQAAIIEMAIRDMARKENLELGRTSRAGQGSPAHGHG